MSKKQFVLKNAMDYLLKSNSYYFKYNRKVKKTWYEQNYHGVVKDPDGEKRKLF